jgi:hypothetical protein
MTFDERRFLETQLLSRRWVNRSRPFPHIVANDVFVPDVYDRLCRNFRETLRVINNAGYLDDHDIFGATITPATAALFEPLTTRAWHDLIAGLVGVHATGHVAVGVHHHRAGSADGFPHNDLNLGWFPGSPASDCVRLSEPDLVEYTTGQTKVPDVTPVVAVRAVAVMFYLENEEWEVGDGGVTGLYASAANTVNRPALIVPPVNNSLLIFECTPSSWHGFIANRRKPRNSVVMWLHRSRDEVAARWGVDSIVPYGRRPPSGTSS